MLDAVFVIDRVAGTPAAVAKFEDIKARSGPYILPSPAYYETKVGYEYNASQDELLAFSSLLRDVDIPAFDAAQADAAAKVQARLIRQGRTGGGVDVTITSYAVSGGHILVTRDEPLVSAARMAGVSVETY